MGSSKLSLVLLIMCLISLLTNHVVLEAEAKAFFVFGDSMVDSGNNNYMVTLIRADKPHYGIDYPGQIATGRFSNGYNIPDLISQAIGEEATMPYMSPDFTGEKLLVGANFASAGVGILNDTGTHFGHHIKIRKQMQYFEEYQQRLSDLIGPQEAQRLVNKALTLVTLGANDFVNNYYLPFSPTSRQYSIPDYVVYLISEYRKILMRLYEMGLRRIVVTGTGPLGCPPAELAVRSQDGECFPELQIASNLFITHLQALLESLNSEIGSDVFIGAHTRQTNLDFVSNPEKYGFVTSKIACCGVGPYNGFGLCTLFSNLCPDRDLYVFWDAFHMTERANAILVQLMLNGSTDHMIPMNISTIMALDADDIM